MLQLFRWICFVVLFSFTFTLSWKYNAARKHDSSEPCRSEDGFQKCRSVLSFLENGFDVKIGDELCVHRKFAYKFCGVTLKCTDDEVRCREICEKRGDIVWGCDKVTSTFLQLRCHPDEFLCQKTKECFPQKWISFSNYSILYYENIFSTSYLSDISDACQIKKYDKFGKRVYEPFGSCYNATKYQCPDKDNKCIPREWVKDGIHDCSNGADEVDSLKCFNQTEFTCKGSHRCIPRYRVNDGFSDCKDSSDENSTQKNCFFHEFKCNLDKRNKTRCIPRSWVGNSIRDCESGEDESHSFDQCIENEVECLDKSRCLPQKLICDGILNCKDGSDEIEMCDLNNYVRSFRGEIVFVTSKSILSGLKNLYVEGLQYYSNLIFGNNCQKKTNSFIELPNKFQNQTTPDSNMCSNIKEKCLNNQNQFICSKCLDNKTIIFNSQVCDNIIDCPDASDECTCEKSSIESLCQKFYPIVTSSNSENLTKYHFEILCNNIDDLENGTDEKVCSKQVLSLLFDSNQKNETLHTCSSHNLRKNEINRVISVRSCDHKVDCHLKDDECSEVCVNSSLKWSENGFAETFNQNFDKFSLTECFPFLRLTSNLTSTRSLHLVIHYKNLPPSLFLENELLLNSNKILIENQKLYNNKSLITMKIDSYKNITITSMLDFCNIRKYLCSWRFYCKSEEIESIDLIKVCDYNVDCLDSSDEMNCSKKTHFYCWNNNSKFIEKSKYLDGRKDCSDGSDEKFNYFSSVYEMIKSNFLRYFIWFVTVLTITVNIYVIRKHWLKLKEAESKSSVKYVNTFLLCQLAVSDLVMGVSLSILGVKSFQYSGQYCIHDLEWRASTTCNVVGVLAVFSSQTSMTTLVLITTLRLYLTVCPYKTNRLNHKFIRLVSFLSLVFCFLFAMIPVWFKYNFADQLYIESNPFFLDQSVNHSTIEMFYKKTEIILSNLPNTSSMFNNSRGTNLSYQFIKTYFESGKGESLFQSRNVKIKNAFGYFSTSPVCFPDLYTSISSSHFVLSLIIITFHTCSLLYICAAYSYMFYATKKSSKSVKQSKNANQMGKMKLRVFLIIITDMSCWLPVIIMSIISYSGYKLDGEVLPYSAIIILPINSAINPIIYSGIDKTITSFIRINCCRMKQESVKKTENIELKTIKPA